VIGGLPRVTLGPDNVGALVAGPAVGGLVEGLP
jgi:hypothetical protein